MWAPRAWPLGAVCLLLAAGCTSLGGTDAPPPDAGPPATAADCDYLPLLGGDPGVVAGFDWPPGEQQYGARVTLYVCVRPAGRTSLVVTGGPGVQVAPRMQAVLPDGNGVVPFVVRVRRGAGGSIVMRHLAAGQAQPLTEMRGPTVVPDPEGWHFAAPEG